MPAVLNPDYEMEVRASFARQTLMATLGASLVSIEPGRVEISMPFGEHLLQQNGYLHAGAITSIADSACGYAAFTLIPPGANILSIEFKVNFLSPASGLQFLARGRVVRSGRRIIVTSGEVFCTDDGIREPVALMTATMMVVA